MAGYRRFIAYVYEYRKGKKSSNSGFIKIEVREGRCRMEIHLQCPGLAALEECRIYGFVRNGGLMDGYLLGSCVTGEERTEHTINTDPANMGKHGFSLRQLGGMILRTENGAFFATEWDDQPVRPENFREIQEPPQPVSAEKGRETEEKQIKAVEKQEDDKDQKADAEETAADITDEKEDITDEKEDTTDEKGDITDENDDITVEKEDIIDLITDNADEKDAAADQRSDAEADMTDEIPDAVDEPQEMEDLQKNPGEEEKKEEFTEEQFPPYEEKFEPFMDGDILDCKKIQPRELARFSRYVPDLRSNRFLQHGYQHFGYLLLGKKAGGPYVLGVPGGYDQQERFMANMFGFPYFKESGEIELPSGKGGYWYRLIDAPNFN